MNRCIIHVGMHKTGSTSIQSSLNNFSNDRFYYANLGNNPNHSLAMHSMFSGQPEKHHLHFGKNLPAIAAYVAASWKCLEQSINEADGRTLVISGEGIGLLSYANLVKVHDYFSKCFDEIEIVGYVRPPIGFMTSGFQERVKVVANANFNIEQEYRNYQNSFGKFDDIFGLENVHLWKFDPKTFYEGCVVQNFCSGLGIDLPKDNIVRVNESLSLQAIALLYIYRKFGVAHKVATLHGAECMRLGKLFKSIGDDKLRFSSKIINPILEKNTKDIEWIKNRLNTSFHEEIGDGCGYVSNEFDLFKVGLNSVAQLLALVGYDGSDSSCFDTPNSIASLVQILRDNLKKTNRGYVTCVERNVVSGWVVGEDFGKPVCVKLLVNGIEIGQQFANLPKPSLKEIGVHPSGLCGFCFNLKNKLLYPGDIVVVKPVDESFVINNKLL